MKSLLFFDSMITPQILTVVYWFLLVSVVIGGLFTMFSSSFFAGLGMIIGGAIGVRIWCELLIVIFKINENLKRMADKEA